VYDSILVQILHTAQQLEKEVLEVALTQLLLALQNSGQIEGARKYSRKKLIQAVFMKN
jgi:hypothetical protein